MEKITNKILLKNVIIATSHYNDSFFKGRGSFPWLSLVCGNTVIIYEYCKTNKFFEWIEFHTYQNAVVMCKASKF